jgi:DNA (cytosine-5)-methyltransferase 1
VNYYNEHDPNAAEWLMELVESEDLPFGYVDSRDVQEVTVDDIKKFKQHHWFAGIGG